MQIRSTAFLSVVAAALVLAACRGGDEATPTPTRTPTPTPTATATATATSTPATGDSGQRDETSLGAFTGDDPCDAIEYVWQRPEGSPLPDRPHQTPRTDFGRGLRDYAEDILDGDVECMIEGEVYAMVAVELGRDATQADVDRVLADLRSAGIAVAGGAISLGPFTVIPFEGLRIDDQDTAGAVFYPGGPFGLVSAGPVGPQAGGAGGVLYSPGGEGRIRRRP